MQPMKIEGGLRTLRRFIKQSMPGFPLVSVVTVVHNGEKTLEKTIQSVLNQSYENIEYVIIDGGSTDRTLDIIRNYEGGIAYWISEPDRGISDAFNKGIICSTGDIVGIINADDWMSPDQVEQGVRTILNTKADFVFGDLLVHNDQGLAVYQIKGDRGYSRIIHSNMPDLCHPSVLVRKTAYDRFGLFDITYKYAMDYEWFLRLHTQGGRGIYTNTITAHMRLSGTSDRSYSRALEEVRDIAIKYGKNRFGAHLLCAFRITKGRARRILEHLIPQQVVHWLRRAVNRGFFSLKSSNRNNR